MKKDPVLLRRVYVLIAVMGLWGTVIGARLYFLQVVQSDSYRKRADDQQQKTIKIIPPRGSILDSNGNALAVSVPVKTIFARPREIADVVAAAKALSAITGQSIAEITDKLRTEDREVQIKSEATDAEVSAIEKSRLAGIGVLEESRRRYPNNDLAAQVLGFVGSDEKGLGGLEYQYEEVLAGSSGKVVYVKDGRRRRYGQSEQPAQPGANLVTTLDKNVQFYVRQAVHDAIARTHARAIYVAVMDPRSGAILAMENYPSFDPNNWRDYDPLFRKNGAIEHTYEPGSTFKILTVGAALEEGLTTPDERIDCLLGSIVVAGHRIHDHKAFSVLTVSEIMQKSSDVGAITLGLRLKEERMARYIKLYRIRQEDGNRPARRREWPDQAGFQMEQEFDRVYVHGAGNRRNAPADSQPCFDGGEWGDSLSAFCRKRNSKLATRSHFAHRAGRQACHVFEERTRNAGDTGEGRHRRNGDLRETGRIPSRRKDRHGTKE